MQSVTIEIINWSHYNKRPDIKKTWWFAMSNSFFEEQKFGDWSLEDRAVWLYLLCIASKEQSAKISVNLAFAKRVAGISPQILNRVVMKLEKIQCIRVHVHDPYGSVRDPVGTGQEKTGQNTIAHSSQDSPLLQKKEPAPKKELVAVLHSVYEKYPRKLGKSTGMKRLEKELTTMVELELFQTAVQNYVNECEINKTETKFIKHFSTFSNCWRDYVDAPSQKAQPGSGNFAGGWDE